MPAAIGLLITETAISKKPEMTAWRVEVMDGVLQTYKVIQLIAVLVV